MRTRQLRTTIGFFLVAAAAAGTLLTGCVEKPKRLSKVDRELAKEIVQKQKPKPQHELDIRFENKLRLLGYDLPEATVSEGRPFKVTWYWQVIEPLGEDWKIFTHLADAENTSRINLDAARPVRRVYPVSEWKRGEYIKDTQEVTLPPDWNSDAAVFYLGFWNGPHRLHVTKGRSDGDNRAEALRIPVSPSGSAARLAQEQVARLIARRATAPIELDGKLDEADWGAAQSSGPFVNTMSGKAAPFEASVKVLYDASHLYLGYQVADTQLTSTHTKIDDHLWEQDTVEVMVDPDSDGKNYFEIQVSPREVIFDTRYDSRREPKPFGHVDWNSQTLGKVVLNGTLNDDKPDVGYTVEAAIPWQAFEAGDPPSPPPAAGATWRMNFFVMDKYGSGQRAAGWSPPRVGDFHIPNRFGRVVFPEGAVEATGQAEGSGASEEAVASDPAQAPSRTPAARGTTAEQATPTAAKVASPSAPEPAEP